MRKAILFIAMVFLVSSAASADTLIYSNSIMSGYYYNPGAYYEVLDYGTSPGGLVSKFSFGYVATNATAGTIWVRFYEGTNSYDPGEAIKMYALNFVPGTNGSMKNYEYVIPEEDRFMLSGGEFGYSFMFSQSTTGIMLAAGGAGNDTYFWEYDEGYYDFSRVAFSGNIFGGFSMKLYTIPEPATLLLLGLGGMMLKRKK